MRKRLLELAAALSLIVSVGCDNVQWGGADIAIIPPPPKGTTAQGPLSEEGERMPQGPVLFYVTPVGSGATITPIAEIAGDTLAPLRPTKGWQTYGLRFIADFMRRGSEFALFHNGARVGTFVLQTASLPRSYACTPLPVGVGTMELATGATTAPQLLALSKTQAPEVRNRLGPDIAPTRGMQIVAPILAERLLRARHAQLPGNWQRAMAQLLPFPLAGAVDPAFAATFLVGDTMGIGPSYGGVAYSLFMIGTPQGNIGYDTAYVEFHDYAHGGKQLTRVIEYLDWNRDDQVELLAQGLSDRQWWFEAYGKRGRGWHRIFRQRCEAPALQAAPVTSTLPQTTTSPTTGPAAGAGEAPPADASPPAAGATPPAGANPPAARRNPAAAAPGQAAPGAAAPAPRRPRLLGSPTRDTTR